MHRRQFLKYFVYGGSGLITSAKMGCKLCTNSDQDRVVREWPKQMNAIQPPPKNSINVLQFIPSSQHAGILQGNSTFDATESIQQALDKARETDAPLFFPPGLYRIRSVTLYPGLFLYGYGATLKRPPYQPNNTRTFTTHYYHLNGAAKFPRLSIHGFKFDGNRAEQGPYQNYEQEQSHLLFLIASPSSLSRLEADIQDCIFQESVADGLSIGCNVDVFIRNCHAYNCFRGGLTISGGNSRVQVDGFRASGNIEPTGLHIELDVPGYNGHLGSEIFLNDVTLSAFFNVLLKDGAKVKCNRLICYNAPFQVTAPASHFSATHSKFVIGIAGFSNYISDPDDVSFNDCEFTLSNVGTKNNGHIIEQPSLPNPVAALNINFNNDTASAKSFAESIPPQRVVFDHCIFRVNDNFQKTTAIYGLRVINAKAPEKQLILSHSAFEPRFVRDVF